MIRIIWLYKYFKEYNFDHWLHMDFARAIKNTEGVDLIGYGHDLQEGYPDLAPIKYDKNISMDDLKKEFDFDIIILNTKSRMFLNYLPPRKYNDKRLGTEIREECWLPKDFVQYKKAPKIVIEEDFHWEDNDNWYVENDINLILQRHYTQSLRTLKINSKWFPFSVDTNVFKSNPNMARNKKICFVGCDAPDCYPHRSTVSNILKSLKMLDKAGGLGRKQVDDNYVKCLQSYICHLNGSSAVEVTAAKMFEIVASGSLLFTNKPKDYATGYGLEKLFPEDAYCTYNEDYSDLIEKAKKIINDETYVKETVERGLKCIKEKHTHPVRIKELLDIIENRYGI